MARLMLHRELQSSWYLSNWHHGKQNRNIQSWRVFVSPGGKQDNNARCMTNLGKPSISIVRPGSLATRINGVAIKGVGEHLCFLRITITRLLIYGHNIITARIYVLIMHGEPYAPAAPKGRSCLNLDIPAVMNTLTYFRKVGSIPVPR